MELVVLLLVISVGLNVLLGLKAVKLSNKKESAEIVADEYKNKADYWHKQYEANKKALPYEKLQESHKVISEAFEELGEWYNQVQKDLDNACEDYEILAEQNDFLNTEYEEALNRADIYRAESNEALRMYNILKANSDETLDAYYDLLEGLLEMSLYNREAYELLISIDKDYCAEKWVVDKRDAELIVTESGYKYYRAKVNAIVYHLDQDLIGEKDCYFYFDYIYDIAEPVLVEY